VLLALELAEVIGRGELERGESLGGAGIVCPGARVRDPRSASSRRSGRSRARRGCAGRSEVDLRAHRLLGEASAARDLELALGDASRPGEVLHAVRGLARVSRKRPVSADRSAHGALGDRFAVARRLAHGVEAERRIDPAGDRGEHERAAAVVFRGDAHAELRRPSRSHRNQTLQ
jgi:hypothetical protein